MLIRKSSSVCTANLSFPHFNDQDWYWAWSQVFLSSTFESGARVPPLCCYTYNRWQFQAKSLEHHLRRSSLYLFVTHVKPKNHNTLIRMLSIKAASTHKRIWLCDSRSPCRPVNMLEEYTYQSPLSSLARNIVSLQETDSKLDPSIL